MFPLSVPLLLYGIIASNITTVALEDLCIAGLLPGFVMLGLVALMGVRHGLVQNLPRSPFRAGEAVAALWQAKWEFGLPVVILFLLVKGYATPVDCAPVAALYALIVQRSSRATCRRFGTSSACRASACARRRRAHSVGRRGPDQLPRQRRHLHANQHVDDGPRALRAVFLLSLNLFLLVVGSVMDIFSAIIVVVPLILPLSQSFGVNPIHLGIIFIAKPGARLPAPAARPQPAAGVGALQEAGARGDEPRSCSASRRASC